MKKGFVLLLLILLGGVLIALINKKGDPVKEPGFSHPRNGVAIIMTGAAARIPQEAALLEELYNRGLLENVVFISGVSSGALNAVALNGILSGRMSWNEYKRILFSLKNGDIFIKEGKKLPLNTAPSRDLYKRIFEDKLRYHKIGDLPITTSISFTHLNKIDFRKTVYRMSNRKINKESDPNLDLVDIIMASTAFPLAFPPAKITNPTTIPDEEYVDGGVGDDHVPFRALYEFERYRDAGVETVYIISRKSDKTPEISEELKGIGINDNGLFDKIGISLDAILSKGINKRIESYAETAPDLIPRTFVWIPDYNTNFLLFNFENLKEQYELTSKWAKTHNPVPLSNYLQAVTSNQR